MPVKNQPAKEPAKEYDVVIIGGGPAGLTAGLYAARSRLNTVLIERAITGGQIVNADVVENYPGFPQGISGYDLGQLMSAQATKFGLPTVTAEATAIEVKGNKKVVKTTMGDFTAKAVIVASGSERMKLGVPGEQEFTGKGVSYCAICDAAFFKDREVAVVGGGNAAIGEAITLTKFASKVMVIHRRDQLRADRISQEKAFAEKKINFIWNTVVDRVVGDDFVRRIELRRVTDGQKSSLEVAGVFVSVGFKPNTDFLKGLLPLDNIGAVITDDRLETSVKGIFAAGDIRHESGRQVIVSAGDGAQAAINAERYLNE